MTPELANGPSDGDGTSQYECPYCDFHDSSEFFIRAHINRSDDDAHQYRDGFMPEDEVAVIESDGDVIRRKSGQPRTKHEWSHELSADDLPSELSAVDRIIILTALRNLPSNYAELESLANQALREEGHDSVSYNKVYRTVKETFSVRTDSQDAMSQQQTQDPKEVYEDLTEKQRAVINGYIRDDSQNMSEIAEAASVDPSYPGQVIEKYGWLADELTNADVIPVGDTAGVSDSESEPESHNDPTPTDEKSYEDLTSLQQEVIDEVVENPDKSYKEIAADVGCDETYPGTITDNFEDIISRRRGDEQGEETRLVTVGGAEYRVPLNVGDAFDELTEKQQNVVEELVAEDNPANPERDRDELGDAAGVHETYVTEVQNKYGELAVTIKSQGERLDEPESTVVETNTEESTADTSDDTEQPFEDKFEAAVNSGSVTDIPVTEIRSNINRISDADLLNQALEQDTRKTSSSEYESRLNDIEEDTESAIDSAESQPREGEVESANIPEVSGEGVPVETLQEMRGRVEMLRRTAESELEESDDKAPAARAKSLTEEFERMIDDAIEGRVP